MRWLFLLLLLANIVYVSWELNREPVQDSGATTAMAQAPRIVLLSELESESSQSAITPPDEESEPAQQKSAEAPLTMAVSDADNSVVEPVVAADEARLEAPAKPADEQIGQRDEVKPDQLPGEDRCYTLGPFRELNELSAFTQAIKSHVVETGFRSRDEQEQAKFWVLLESTGSKAQARALSEELVSKRIKDYFIITSGEHKYGISLGIFRDKERAYQHAKRIRGLGFEPVVEPIIRTYTIYWLNYRMKSGDTIPPHVFQDNLPETVTRLDRPCQP